MQIAYNSNRSAAQLPANVVCWGPLFLWKHNSVTGMGRRHNGQGREGGGFLNRVNLSMAELLSFRSIEKAKWKSEKRQAENGEEYGEGLGKLWEGRRTWGWEWEMQNRLNGNKKKNVCVLNSAPPLKKSICCVRGIETQTTTQNVGQWKQKVQSWIVYPF